jgi:Spy/CpxP family protein refolding chaperone
MAFCSMSSIAFAAGVLGALVFAKHLLFRRRLWAGRCHGRHRRRGIGGSRWLRWIFARLDTTPGQEREIRAAIEELARRARDAKEGLRASRESVGRSVAGDAFDEGAFEAASANADATTAQIKDAFAEALKRIHAVLDPKQRERLGELIASGPFRPFGGGGHPYRAA